MWTIYLSPMRANLSCPPPNSIFSLRYDDCYLEEEIAAGKKELEFLAVLRLIEQDAGSAKARAAFAAVARSTGLSVSYTAGLASLVGRGCNKLIGRKIYEDLAGHHAALLRELQRWCSPTQYEVPPLLAMTLERSRRRSDILPAAIELREDYGGLRRALRDLENDLNPEAPLEQKVRAVQQIEIARRQILSRGVSAPEKPIMIRTWDVVRDGVSWKTAIGIADRVIKAAERRIWVGGLRHFARLERVAASIEQQSKKVDELFGSVRKG
jgi:hypothetical protein